MARGARETKASGDEMNEGEAFNERPSHDPTAPVYAVEMNWSELHRVQAVLLDRINVLNDKIERAKAKNRSHTTLHRANVIDRLMLEQVNDRVSARINEHMARVRQKLRKL